MSGTTSRREYVLAHAVLTQLRAGAVLTARRTYPGPWRFAVDVPGAGATRAVEHGVVAMLVGHGHVLPDRVLDATTDRYTLTLVESRTRQATGP